ncbi:MAG: hypothetical protein A2Y33_00835 [Spirochaetes bacterium GWF1_51_8]|nr:MAG: hypothetical protein A2Y33_00835 [Spirochaetes bacterium GWF1_51_8]
MRQFWVIVLLLSVVLSAHGIELKTNTSVSLNGEGYYLLGWNFGSGFFAQVLNITNMSFSMFDAFGKKYGPFPDGTHVAVSPDCSRFAYTLDAEGKTSIVFDSMIYAEHDGIENLEIVPDGSAPVFIYHENGKDWLSYKGLLICGYREITEFEAAGNSDVFGFIYRIHRSFYVQTGFTNSGPYRKCKELKLSYNGKSCAFFAKSPKLSENMTYGDDAKISISPDGSVTGIVFCKEYLYYLRIGDTVFGPYEIAFEPVFSPDNRYAFGYQMGEECFVRFGDAKYGPADFIYNYAFLPEPFGFGYVYQMKDVYYIRLGEENTLGPFEYADFRIIDGKIYLLVMQGGILTFLETI